MGRLLGLLNLVVYLSDIVFTQLFILFCLASLASARSWASLVGAAGGREAVALELLEGSDIDDSKDLRNYVLWSPVTESDWLFAVSWS